MPVVEIINPTRTRTLDPRDYGWTGGGLTLSQRYGSLVAAQAVYPHAASLTDSLDWAALVAALAEARVSGGPVTVIVPPGSPTRLSYTMDVWNGVRLVGEGIVYSNHAVASRIIPASTFGGGPLLRVPQNSGPSGDDYHHSTLIKDVRIQSGPSHGLHWLGKFSELSYIDGVAAMGNGGDGIRIENDGTPVYIGLVSCHDNIGAGVRLKDLRTVTNVTQITGDGNGESLLTIQDSDPSGLFYIESVKSERATPGVVKLVDLNGAHVTIDQLRCLGSTVSTNPVINQSRTNSDERVGTLDVRAFATPYPYNWAYGYRDQITGLTVTPHDLIRHGLYTRKQRHTDPIRGITESQPLVLTGTVGTSATTWPHGLPYTPAIDAIVPQGDARVWQSSAPDATNIYLQASASVTAQVTLGRGTRLAAFATLAQSDTFTAADGTLIHNRVPDVAGGAWTAQATWTIQSNKAVPSGTFREFYRDLSVSDVRLSAVLNLGPGTTGREVGFCFRRSDASNFWYALLAYTSSSAQSFQIHKIVAGTRSRTHLVSVPTNVLAADTDYTLIVEVRGSIVRALIDGQLIAELVIDTFNNTATQHGGYVGNRGATPFVSIDNLEIRTV